MGANRASIHALNGSSLTLNPEILESKFQQAEQTLEQMIADHYIPGVDAIVGRLAFSGEPATPSLTESFLADAETTWGSLLSGTAPEDLSPSQEEVRNIFLAYSQIFSRYGDNMRKLALHLVQPLNTTNFLQIAQQIKWENEENITNSVHKFFFENNGDPSIIFTTNSILLKNWCITAVNYIYQECQKALETGENLSLKVPNPLSSNFLPMLNGAPTNTMMGLSTRYLTPNGHTNTAIYVSQNGQRISIQDFSEVAAHLGTSAKKLMDVSIAYLTRSNFYQAKNINPTVIIPLMDYWRKQRFPVDPKDDTEKEQKRCERNIKRLKDIIRADCNALKAISFDGFVRNGKNEKQIASYSFVSSWELLRDNKLAIYFDIKLAEYLVHAYQMQFPTALLAHDNRNPNSYAIGRKIALHHSIDHNAAVGTANTISVRALLEAAPEIPSYDSIIASGRRDWKVKIKGVLESSLNDNISVGFLSAWAYRQAGSKKTTTYTPAEASSLTWIEYNQLVIDFELADEPDQTERRERRNAEIAKRAAEKAKQESKPKKKRGRPKKTTNT